MVKLTYTQLKRNPHFAAAVRKIRTATTLAPKVAYNVAKLCKGLEDEWKLADDLHMKILDKYCAKDEKGAMKIKEGNYELQEGVDTTKFEKEMDDYWNVSFTIERNKIKLDDLGGMNPALSADELTALEPMLDV